MPVETLVPLEEYLNTSYEPDCDYVDGVLLERNVGEHEHSRLQALLIAYLVSREGLWGIHAVPEQRVQVSKSRCRVPDVCVLLASQPIDEILQTPPFLCVEILSESDNMSDMQERIDDYINFGVPFIWIVDPRRRKSYLVRKQVMTEVTDGMLRTSHPEIAVPIDQLYGC